MRVVLGCLFLAALIAAPFLIAIYLVTEDREYRKRVLEREAGNRIVAKVACPDEVSPPDDWGDQVRSWPARFKDEGAS